MNTAHFILYVSNQDASTEFYSRVLGFSPRLHVPGMTEFDLPGGARELSPLQTRDWGHDAAYTLDPDGHVVAFARVTRER